jgi:hypothetical protein
VDETDPKQFVDDAHTPVAGRREIELVFEDAGFSDVNLIAANKTEDPYAVLYASRRGTEQESVERARELFAGLGIYPTEIKSCQNHQFGTIYAFIPLAQIEWEFDTPVAPVAEADATADMPKQRAEIKILPAKGMNHHHDIVLISDHAPLYVGTIAPKHSVWRVVKTANNVGRMLRTKLHWHAPTKEDCAIRMVGVLRPYWKPIISSHGFMGMFEDDATDPKAFVDREFGNLRTLRDLQKYPDDQIFACVDPTLIKQWNLPNPFYCWHVYWKGGGIVSVEFEKEQSINTRFHSDFAQIQYLKPVSRVGASSMFESTKAEIEAEAAQAEKPASDEQAEAGNYKKGHVSVQGLEIAIENAKGSTRSGVNKAGEAWKVTLPAHYGYIKGTEGKDKDHLDVYIGDNPGGMLVFVVNQKREEGGFDEHKIMLGFASKAEAIETYDRAFTGDLGPKLRETVVSTTMDKLKEWIKSGNTKKPFEALAESLVADLIEDADVDPKEYVQQENPFSRVDTGRPTEDGFYIYFPVSVENTRPFFEGGWDNVEDAVEFYRSEVGSFDAVIIEIKDGHARRVLAYDQIREGAIIANNVVLPLQENDEADPKEMAMSLPPSSTVATDIVQVACNQILATPYEDMERFYAEATRITNDMVDKLEQTTGRVALDGTKAMLRASVPKPWNNDPGHKISRKYARELAASFRNCSKRVKNVQENDEADPKEMAMSVPPEPRVWGDLKVGDVVFNHETGSYERVYGLKFSGGQYQDVNGEMQYDSSPAQYRLYKQFGPSYAYGHYVQHLSAHPKQGLLGAERVSVPDNSDEALWKLVDEEMHRNGTTPEELEQSRADHRAREAARTPEQVDAQRRYDELMGRHNESILENEPEQMSLDDIKAYVDGQKVSLADGIEFHIGFAIITSDESGIESNAEDRGVTIDWDAVNAAILRIEQNAVNGLNQAGINCRSEGHGGYGGGYDDLIGSAWVTGGTPAFEIVRRQMEMGEPYRTSSGTIDGIMKGFTTLLYAGVPNEIAQLIDVGIDFLDVLKIEHVEDGEQPENGN